jgi:hypothetical protein
VTGVDPARAVEAELLLARLRLRGDRLEQEEIVIAGLGAT